MPSLNVHSFDVVSEVDFQEIDNAVNMALKEIHQRFDLRDSKSSIELNKKDKFIVINSKEEFSLKACNDILQNKIIRRGISLKALKYGEIEPSAQGTVKQKIELQSGIDKEQAKIITKIVKDSKLKVNATIQDNQVRITSKDIDDLQKIIKLIKETELPFHTQFVNYK